MHPVEREIRADIARARYANALGSSVSRVLSDAYRKVAETLARADLTWNERQRLERLYRVLAEQIEAAYLAAGDVAAQGLAALAVVESDAAHEEALLLLGLIAGRGVLRSAGSPVDGAGVARGVEVLGIGLDDWWRERGASRGASVAQAVRLGVLGGQRPAAIARTIWSAAKKGGAGALVRRAISEARMIVRTASTAVQADVALAAFRALGRDTVPGVRFDAVRDARTSTICLALDGREYALTDPRLPRPPRHPNCRSRLTPIVVLDGRRLTAPRIDAGEWLRRQSQEMQDRLLGPSRAALWRARRITLDELIDGDSRPITLARLRKELGIADGAGV